MPTLSRTDWPQTAGHAGQAAVGIEQPRGQFRASTHDAAMQLGADGVFLGSGIFRSGDPAARAAAIVKATTFHDDPDVIAKVSRGLARRWWA